MWRWFIAGAGVAFVSTGLAESYSTEWWYIDIGLSLIVIAILSTIEDYGVKK